MNPNIFYVATSELSHDAFFTWLLQWADPKHSDTNQELHLLGKSFIKLLLHDQFAEEINTLSSIKAVRQWKNIDVWVEIFCSNTKILLIVENKTFTVEHSNQLLRYKETGETFCAEQGFELSCAYVKVGSETKKLITAIQEKGYKTVHRQALLQFFSTMHCKHPLVADYVNYLQKLEDTQNEYKTKAVKDWDGACWVGFYQHIESMIPVNMWHYVNNPGGGFWNLSLNWKTWDDIPVYTQIEERKITFKVALSENETGLEDNEIDKNAVQNFIHDKLLAFGKQSGFAEVEYPPYMQHRGAYRAIGVIKSENWLGDLSEPVELNQTILFLKRLESFYEAFVDHLRSFSYEQFIIKQEEVSLRKVASEE
ncbi:PD-(D/E)XK nuclease superfamily protein [Lacibacter cauensis]|uniref:PD-(D/E)XK nuclease superfamily protein n=1 Tax=Lacibacter cauensis TaxID=510947 RepID=A0A562SQ12_9BACT|nr:PD-(D/E)XK nuclease family protein [Lacibacter cauensis]TWI83278.1 PD-(D/E)XK nuclease superfamily protein [Lacibacter cauensis]